MASCTIMDCNSNCVCTLHHTNGTFGFSSGLKEFVTDLMMMGGSNILKQHC